MNNKEKFLTRDRKKKWMLHTKAQTQACQQRTLKRMGKSSIIFKVLKEKLSSLLSKNEDKNKDVLDTQR